MKRSVVISFLFLMLSGACAQHVGFRSFKHYNVMVDSLALVPQPTINDIVMLGDSHTEFGGDWNCYFDGVCNIRNYGIAGDDAIGIRHRLCQICPSGPRAIFFECGINDLSHNLTPSHVASDILETIDSIRSLCPMTKLFVQGVFPVNMEVRRWKTLDGKTDEVPELNSLLMAGCRERDIIYIDVFRVLKEPSSNKLRRELCRDGLHLTPAGYRLWADVIASYVYSMSQKDSE